MPYSAGVKPRHAILNDRPPPWWPLCLWAVIGWGWPALAADSPAAYAAGASRRGVEPILNLLLPAAPALPAEMVFIPAGAFTMGNATNVFPATEGSTDEVPMHEVQASGFYVAAHEVTKAQWDEVYTWAVARGYSFDHPGSGKATNHPVFGVNWHDVVKWCNARSQREGRDPCYTTNGGIYASGHSAPDCNWAANGYRLPTEAEWEKAARGGTSARRFPWPDTNTIQHTRANYFSYWSDGHPYYVFDTNPTEGDSPAYAVGGMPFTSPVGSFAANSYGLHDMAGNVREWCWDWYGSGYYQAAPAADPRGPATGNDRVMRGGGWDGYAYECRVAWRLAVAPDHADFNAGFRVVLGAIQ